MQGGHSQHQRESGATLGSWQGQSRPGLGIMRCLSDAVTSADREAGEHVPPSVRMAQENTQSRRQHGDPNAFESDRMFQK